MWAEIARDSVTRARLKEGMIRLDTLGGPRDTVEFPTWGAVPPVLTASSNDGGSRMTLGLPWLPGSRSALTRDGGIVSGYGADYVFYLLAPTARPVRVARAHTPVPVTDLEATERRAQITQRLRRVNAAWTWTGPGLPTQKPAFRDFLAGADGSIWVRISTPGEAIPAAELPPIEPGPDPSVRLTNRDPNVYDVYSAEGRPLGRVTLPPRTRLLRVSRAHAWGVQQDSLDVSYAVRFRISPTLSR
jgi:hypothetical protein